jgi:hypothetical protein
MFSIMQTRMEERPEFTVYTDELIRRSLPLYSFKINRNGRKCIVLLKWLQVLLHLHF